MLLLSKTDIANLALNNVKSQEIIENLDTDPGTAADALRRWYDVARSQTLADFDWTFARTRQVLAAHPDDPPTEWALRYLYPSTALQPRLIENPVGPDADPVPFAVERAPNGTRSILTDLDEACLIFTADVTDTTLFSVHFTTTLALLWAWYVSGAITGDQALRDKLEADYRTMILFATANDANVGMARKARDAEWIRER